jgi:hypothetical protein
VLEGREGTQIIVRLDDMRQLEIKNLRHKEGVRILREQ